MSEPTPAPGMSREQALALALMDADPDATVTLKDGQLSVSTTLSEDEVLAILATAGIDATPHVQGLDDGHVSGGSTCCGGCS